MKLMIDIPEEDYNNIEPFLNGETIKGGFNLFKALEIIKNGNPLPTVIEALEQEPCEDCISRQAVLDDLEKSHMTSGVHNQGTWNECVDSMIRTVRSIPSVNPQKYEYHIDHTDCIWYGSDSGCPVTCSQYRDGWNDAMDYIFKNGKGYQPYRRDG